MTFVILHTTHTKYKQLKYTYKMLLYSFVRGIKVSLVALLSPLYLFRKYLYLASLKS